MSRSASLALYLCALLLTDSPSRAADDTPIFYEHRDTWAQTMLASRQRFIEWAEQHRSQAVRATFGPWYRTDPLPSKSFDEVLFPEKGVNLKAKTADGSPVWRKERKWRDGVVQRLTPDVVGATYLYRTINAPAATTLEVGVGSDDGIAVWLNGKQLLANNVARGTVPDQDRVELPLREGENQLLLKIYNLRGGHSYYFSTEPNPLLLLLSRVQRDFPQQMQWFNRDVSNSERLAWFDDPTDTEVETNALAAVFGRLGEQAGSLTAERKRLQGAPGTDPRWLDLYAKAARREETLGALLELKIRPVRMALEDMRELPGSNRAVLDQSLTKLRGFESRLAALGDAPDPELAAKLVAEYRAFTRTALLSNPLLEFDNVLVVRRRFGDNARRVISKTLGLPSLNSHTNDTIPHTGWDNEIAQLSDLRSGGTLKTIYKPEGGKILTDVDLNWDADKVMFSSIGTHDRWQLFELDLVSKQLRQLTPTDLPDVDHFDSCYLPDGAIAFTSTASMQGLPCENGGKPMAQLYRMEADGSGIRQLTFEQDSDWSPVVLNTGRLMYLRWEYTDLPHYFSRILFQCNPDGTGQMAYYGSNSYFPNSFFFARPLPNHPMRVIGVAGGHHGLSRSGRLLIIDPTKGTREGDGVVQELPGWGKPVEPVIRDRLVDGVWPQFLHPYPLNDKYFLVAAKPSADSLWGIYLVDVFDNLTLVCEEEGAALLEPFPCVPRPRPPVLSTTVRPEEKEGTVYLTDLYSGPGLKGLPRGSVKRLRLFSYHFAYNRSGGHASVGVESSWDVKRLLGTVPVEPDGSALFRIPANTPVSLQPLDEKGRALQLMRSWFVTMPGERLSCTGCHESQLTATPNPGTMAAQREPSEIEPWRGPARPFSFRYEVQPVLDKYCVGCHDGKQEDNGKLLLDFTRSETEVSYQQDAAYLALHPYVRRPGPESDIHMFRPMEYHASTSELIQMLEKGHHNVQLDDEAWDRLYTWIDLNAPYRGKWAPREWRGEDQCKRRLEFAALYANLNADPEAEYDAVAAAYAEHPAAEPILPEPLERPVVSRPKVASWPLLAPSVQRLQTAQSRDAGGQVEQTVDLGAGVQLKLRLIPAGEFVMGSDRGYADELPLTAVRIEKPFWLGEFEVTNEQFGVFDPTHDSRYIDQQWKDHTTPGYPANLPQQPVIRVTWNQAHAYCRWLSEKTGRHFALPTEAQWEWACRAGTDTPLWFGEETADFAGVANLGDKRLELFAVKGVNPKPVANPSPLYAFLPRVNNVDDGQMIAAPVGSYQPNPWGLHDMHGNVAEWTRSLYRPYPYVETDGRNDLDAGGRRVVRGGSWRDRPHRARSAFRLAYQPYQPVSTVGFRVACQVE